MSQEHLLLVNKTQVSVVRPIPLMALFMFGGLLAAVSGSVGMHHSTLWQASDGSTIQGIRFFDRGEQGTTRRLFAVGPEGERMVLTGLDNARDGFSTLTFLDDKSGWWLKTVTDYGDLPPLSTHAFYRRLADVSKTIAADIVLTTSDDLRFEMKSVEFNEDTTPRFLAALRASDVYEKLAEAVPSDIVRLGRALLQADQRETSPDFKVQNPAGDLIELITLQQGEEGESDQGWKIETIGEWQKGMAVSSPELLELLSGFESIGDFVDPMNELEADELFGREDEQ